MSSDFGSKCRTCLSESTSYYQLSDYVEDYKILEMLDCIVPQIDVKKTFQFSCLVCQICVEKLLIGYKFQQLCIETNNQLHDLLGISLFETQANLEKILDPLTPKSCLKLKEEVEDVCFESEIPTDDLDEGANTKSDSCLDTAIGSDSDSSNEKLSVLRKRSIQKFPLKAENVERYKYSHTLTEDVQLKYSNEKIGFQCPECSETFKKKTSFSTHYYKVHKKQELLKKKIKNSPPELRIDQECGLKNAETNSKVGVKEELEIAPQMFDNGNNCDNSDNSEDELFTTSGPKGIKNIDFVVTSIGEIENFPCKICGKIFDRPYNLKRHNSVHSLARPYECEICKYRFATVNILKAHLLQHTNDTGGTFLSQTRPESFKCPDCPRRFVKQASLSAHQKSHTRNASKAKYPCVVCQRSFMINRSLTEHFTNKHPEIEKHKCGQCEKTFVLHAQLVEHLKRHKDEKNLICLICEKEFRHNTLLKKHMLTHTGESHLCPQCGKTFPGSSNFREHMKRHTGLRKYQCPECPSRFNCRTDLVGHASTHSNAKPHVCEICSSRFTRSTSLRKHKLLHSGERPFKCDQCNMTFVIIHTLRRHMRTHTGEKPHKCKYCERAYSSNGDLTKHLRTHVGENTYMCDQCPMTFKYQAELRKHQAHHYKMTQKLLEQSQKMSEEPQQQANVQIQHDQPNLQTEKISENEHIDQHLFKPEQMQHLSVGNQGIPNYQEIPLIEHLQQMTNAIVDQAQNHTKAEDIVSPHQKLN